MVPTRVLPILDWVLTCSYVWHDSFICVTRLIQLMASTRVAAVLQILDWAMSYSYVWHGSIKYTTCMCVFFTSIYLFFIHVCVFFFFKLAMAPKEIWCIIYLCRCIHTHIHTYIHAYIHTYVYTCIRMYTKTRTYTHTQTHTHAHAHTFSLYCPHSYTHTHTRTLTHTPSRMNRAIFRNNIYIYICIHTGWT